LYFAGQMVSSIGTFMQAVAQPWLVLQLTGSGAALGLLTTLQFGRCSCSVDPRASSPIGSTGASSIS
jgi:hypothetical protein